MRIGRSRKEQGTLTIKYNGEFWRFPWKEAVILAQKGMNYDRMLENWRNWKKPAGDGAAEYLAKRWGWSRRWYAH